MNQDLTVFPAEISAEISEITEQVLMANGDRSPEIPVPRVWLVDGRGAGIDLPTLRAQVRSASRELTARAEDDSACFVSRSYRHPLAVIGINCARLGVDIERVDPFDEHFAESICTPDEWKSSVHRPATAEELADLWSSKEALAKALGDALDYDPRRLPCPALVSGGTVGRWHVARLPVPPGYVGWVVWEQVTEPKVGAL